MHKVWIGLLLGTGLGVLDGLSSLLYPEARPMIMGILIGSTIKGLIAGVLIALFSYRVSSLPAGLFIGLLVGLGLAYWVAAAQDKYYLEIMVPGSLVGLILGYATQKYGRKRSAAI